MPELLNTFKVEVDIHYKENNNIDMWESKENELTISVVDCYIQNENIKIFTMA